MLYCQIELTTLIINRVFQQQMETPTILDLQYLLSQLTESQNFNYRELQILQRTTYALNQPGFISSEMANLSNQIWLVFSQQGHQYWHALSYLLGGFQYQGTRLMALGTLANRISRQWILIDQSIKKGIQQYIVSLIKDTILVQPSNQRNNLLARANEVLVAMLKHEWTGLFKDFITNMVLEAEETSTAKLLNNFSILTMLLKESVDCWDSNMTASQAEIFRNSVDDDMRNILKIACRCLQNKVSVDRMLIISQCLQMLSQTMECMPAYQLFNCNLIELMVELLEQRQFQKPLRRCFQSIFNFRQRSDTNENHNRIAWKLLMVLEVFLHRYEESSRPVSHADKQSTSTQDSFDERRVNTRRETAYQLSTQVLDLLHQFLRRYIPFMDKKPQQNDVEVEFDGFTKIHFSKQLYESLGKIYWKMINFLNKFISLYVKFNLEPEEDEETIDKEIKVLDCAKFLLTMMGKLKIPIQPQLSIMIEQLILNFTPLSKEFSKFYVSFGLILNDGEIYSECRQFSSQSITLFISLIDVIMKDPKLVKIYAEVVQKKLQSIKKIQNAQTSKNVKGILENISPKNIKTVTNQNQSMIEKAINIVNRLTWSMVLAFSVNQSIPQKVPINTYINSFTKKIHMLDATKLSLKRCYSLNSKYLMMAYPLTLTLPNYRGALFGCLQTTKNDLMNECVILLLSQMMINPYFTVNTIDWNQLTLLVQKIHQVQKGAAHSEQLIKIYPVLYNFFLKKITTDSSKQGPITTNMKQTVSYLIEEELKSFSSFAKQQQVVTDGAQIKRCLFYFSKLSAITEHLKKMFSSSQSTGIKGLNYFIKSHIALLRETIKVFQYKYFLYSNHLKNQTRQSFQNSDINQFRCTYNSIVCQHLQLVIIKTQLETKNQQLAFQQKKKIILEERSNYIRRCWETLTKDFHQQTEFKCDQYLSFAIPYYKWLTLIKYANANKQINTSITEICVCLNQQSCLKFEYLKLKKYAFWRQVVQLFLFHLNEQNCQQLMKVFEQVSGCSVLSATNVQTIMEIEVLVFNTLNDHCDDNFQKEPAIWNFIMSIFNNTFADLFTFMKNQNFFKRVSQIFHLQIIVASRWSRPIFKDPRQQQGKSNSQVLFLYLQNFVVSKVPMSNLNQQHHNNLMIRMFKQKKQNLFVDKVRDYVISVNRMIANTRKSQIVS